MSPFRNRHSDRCGPRCAFLILPLLVCLCADGRPQYVEISAQLELTGYRRGDTNKAVDAKPKLISVRCVTGTNEWLLEDDRVQNAKSIWLFDGTNIYMTSHLTRPLPEETQRLIASTTHLAQAPFEEARSNLSISVWPSRAGHPLGIEAANIAWLAFCSRTYLKMEARLIPLPLENLRHTRDRFAYADTTETFDDDFGLPRRVDLFLSRDLFLVSETEFDKEYFFGDRYTGWVKRTAENLPEGALMFHYAVTESTNFSGRNFPTKFEFYQNGRNFEQNGDWYWHGTGTVQSIREAVRPGPLFDTSLKQTIIDWRFRDPASGVDAIIYGWTNTFLAPTNDPFLQEQFARRAAQIPRMKRQQPDEKPEIK